MKRHFLEDGMICIMPYFIFIIPVIPMVKNLNYAYLVFIFLYIISNFRVKEIYKVKELIILNLIFILYAFTSLMWSNNFGLGIITLLSLVTGFIIELSICFFINQSNIDKFLKHITICTSIILCLSLYEIITGNYIFVTNLDFVGRLNSYTLYCPITFFANPNDLAYYMMIAMPICISYLKNIQNRLKRKIYIVTFFTLSVFVIWNTESRISLISLCIIFLIVLIFFSIRNTKKFIHIFTIAVLIIIGGFVISKISNINLYQILNIDDLFRINKNESYFTVREILLKEAYNLGIEKFPFGAGLGTVTSMLNIPPHNIFALFWADLGFIGFGIFLIYYILIIKKILFGFIKIKQKNKKYSLLYALLIAMMINFPIASNISSGAEQRKITWLLFGMSIALVKLTNEVRNNK